MSRLAGLEKTTPGSRTRGVTSSPAGALFLPSVAALCTSHSSVASCSNSLLYPKRYLPLVGFGKHYTVSGGRRLKQKKDLGIFEQRALQREGASMWNIIRALPCCRTLCLNIPAQMSKGPFNGRVQVGQTYDAYFHPPVASPFAQTLSGSILIITRISFTLNLTLNHIRAHAPIRSL